MSPEVLCDEKKLFQMFQRKVFFKIVYGLWSEKIALSKKKIIVLVLKTLYYVSRGTFSEKTFVWKSSFFCKILPGIKGKYFGLLGKLFPARLSSFRPTFAGEAFMENFSRKKFFFTLFPDKEQKIDHWKDIRMIVKTLFYVSGGIFLGKTFFLK